MRLSSFLAEKYSISRRYAKRLIANGHVKYEKSIIKTDFNIDVEQKDTDKYIADINETLITYKLENYLIEQNDDVVFLYKPCNMNTERHTPEDPLCLSDIAEKEFNEYQLISRLDYAVDGAVAAVHKSIKITHLNKRYLAFVHNIVTSKIDGYWGVDAHKRKKVAVIDDTDEYMSFTPVWSNIDKNISLVQVEIENAGRHQVRAVCAYLGYPILGDTLYGGTALNSCKVVNEDTTPEDTGKYRIALHCVHVQVNDHICSGLNSDTKRDKTLLHHMTEQFMEIYKR